MADVEVYEVKDFKQGESKIISARGKSIAVFNVKGEFFAINNECPHMAGSLGHGIVENHCISCPLHFWKFDLKTGKGIQPEGPKVECFKTKVKNNKLFVEV